MKKVILTVLLIAAILIFTRSASGRFAECKCSTCNPRTFYCNPNSECHCPTCSCRSGGSLGFYTCCRSKCGFWGRPKCFRCAHGQWCNCSGCR